MVVHSSQPSASRGQLMRDLRKALKSEDGKELSQLVAGNQDATYKNYVSDLERGKKTTLPKLLQYLQRLQEFGLTNSDAGKAFGAYFPEQAKMLSVWLAEQSTNWGETSQIPRPWISTNHSWSRIVWVDADAELKARALKLVKEHFSQHVRTPTIVKKPLHVTGSDVVKVASAGSNRALLLKIHRHKINSESIGPYLKKLSDIANSNVFDESSDYLRPLIAGNPAKQKLWIEDSEGRPVIAFPFLSDSDAGEASGVAHFTGESAQEIRSAARILARLNKHLHDHPAHEFESLSSARGDAMRDWKELRAKLGPEKRPYVPSRSWFLAEAERELIDSVVAKAGKSLVRKGGAFAPTIADVHPHNIFSRNGEAFLMFDYDFTTGWPEAGTVWFALHRMVREHVRQHLPLDFNSTQIEKTIYEAVVVGSRAFLEGYEEGWPGRKFSVKLVQDGPKWATAINLVKLFHNLKCRLLGQTDPLGRSEQHHFDEVVKFLSYLRELVEIEKILAVSDWRTLSRDRPA